MPATTVLGRGRGVALLLLGLLLPHAPAAASSSGSSASQQGNATAHQHLNGTGLVLSSFSPNILVKEKHVHHMAFTLANPAGASPVQGLNVEVTLPDGVRFHQGSGERRAGMPIVHKPRKRAPGLVVLNWTRVELGPGEKETFWMEFHVERIAARDHVPFHIVASKTTGAGNDTQRVPLATEVIKMPKDFTTLHEWVPFEEGQCTPHTGVTTAVEGCIGACPPTCLACGLDPATRSCVCKRRSQPDGPDQVIEAHPELAPVPPAEAEAASAAAAATAAVNESATVVPPSAAAAATGGPHRTVRAEEILVFPNLVSEAEMAKLDAYLDELVVERARAREIASDPKSPLHRLMAELVPLAGLEFAQWVTFSDEDFEVAPHYDQLKSPNVTHKLLLYHDAVAGTRFWKARRAYELGRCPLIVQPARGTVVVFPISLYHDSDRFTVEGANKRTLGLRMVLPGDRVREVGTWGLLTEGLAARAQEGRGSMMMASAAEGEL